MRRGSPVDELLTVIFMLLAIGAVVCYFAVPSNPAVYWILGGLALLLRITQYILRFF